MGRANDNLLKPNAHWTQTLIYVKTGERHCVATDTHLEYNTYILITNNQKIETISSTSSSDLDSCCTPGELECGIRFVIMAQK